MARVQTEPQKQIGWKVSGDSEITGGKYIAWSRTKKGCEDWAKSLKMKNPKFYPIYAD